MLREAVKYPATLTGYGIAKDSKGNPRFWAQFTIDDNGQQHSVGWSGSTVTDKSKDRTIKAYITLGLQGNDLSVIGDGMLGGALNAKEQYTVTLQLDRYLQGGQTKERWQVKYINALNDPKFQAAHAEMKDKVKAMTADVMAVRASMGVPSNKKYEPGF